MRTMYKRKVDVDMLNAVESANTLFKAFRISTSTLRLYTGRFTATPRRRRPNLVQTGTNIPLV